MDSRKLFNILMDGSNPNILDYVDDASETIKELLIENQSLRIAANYFKDQAKKAEEEFHVLKNLLSAVKNMEKFYPKDTEFFVFTKDQADEITKRAVLAEERAEKAEKERDAAIEELKNSSDNCEFCLNSEKPPYNCPSDCLLCQISCRCKHCYSGENWEWKGLKEE